MDSKVNAATWAMARGVSVVICNGMQEKAIKTIISGRKVGTFFTDHVTSSATSVDVLAENGNLHTFISSRLFSIFISLGPSYFVKSSNNSTLYILILI